jgi:hypothetical protein
MTTDRKKEPVWVTQKQPDDHITSFGQPSYDPESEEVKGMSEAPNPVSDILVRKVEGKIEAIAGSERLEVKLQEFGKATVRFLSGREASVFRASDGQLVEK